MTTDLDGMKDRINRLKAIYTRPRPLVLPKLDFPGLFKVAKNEKWWSDSTETLVARRLALFLSEPDRVARSNATASKLLSTVDRQMFTYADRGVSLSDALWEIVLTITAPPGSLAVYLRDAPDSVFEALDFDQQAIYVALHGDITNATTPLPEGDRP